MGTDQLSGKLAVILHADVVGSTSLVQIDEILAHQRIQDAFQRFSKIIAGHGGIAHEIRGDALVAEFSKASDAVAASIDFQTANTSLIKDLPDQIRPKIRVGIAMGEVVIADNTVTGEGVVLAQRVEQLAAPGGLRISAAVREAIPSRLPYRYSFLGEHTVKGFDEPVRVFSVESQGVVPEPESTPRRNRFARSRATMLMVVFIIVVGLGAWYAFSIFGPSSNERLPSLGTQLSVAVLPFVNLSGDEAQNYFADVLTADLTSDLSRIAGSFVISRSTAATYRGRDVDPKKISRELAVRYLLEGTVRRSGSEVHVNVQLVDGETGRQVWSERYQKPAADMYSFQDEVTGRVARTLNLELKDVISRQVVRGDAADLDATDLAHRAWAELWTKPQNPTTNEAALSYVSRALAINPNHAEALGVAAYAYARAATYGWGMPRAEALEKGTTAGEKSISLEPNNADAIYSLAFIYYVAGETQKSQELMRQSIAVNRNHAPAYFFYGLNLIRMGRPRDAVQWIERAFALSPRDPLRSVWYSVIARAHLLNRQDALAIEAAKKGVASNSKHPNNHAVLASAYVFQGNMEKAEAALHEFIRTQPGITVSRYQRQLTADDPVAVKTYRRLIDGIRQAGLPE